MGRRRRFADTVRSSVVVQLKSDRTITGVMDAEYRDCLALVSAHLLDPEFGATSLDGEVLIRWEEVSFTQLLAGPVIEMSGVTT